MEVTAKTKEEAGPLRYTEGPQQTEKGIDVGDAQFSSSFQCNSMPANPGNIQCNSLLLHHYVVVDSVGRTWVVEPRIHLLGVHRTLLRILG